MNTNNLYYLMSLAAFIATLLFQGRRSRRDELDVATASLLGTYQQTITAQAERIALLERDKSEQADLIQKLNARTDYLEELLLGHGHDPKLVQQGAVPDLLRPGRVQPSANPATGANG